eukprot:TRINITY_DN45926_c0_g1_i1.p1 TRINITY_DN45926_c0_g1~~TRINITY_DN45926_c0_g1_i1.p1  ORF type:complete len:472 (+),score=42.22 TRINITY_DN45926_c0_g1_i1:123-1538(+)
MGSVSRVDTLLGEVQTWTLVERQTLLLGLLRTAGSELGLSLSAVGEWSSSLSAIAGSERFPVTAGSIGEVVGCPWCRRPLSFNFVPSQKSIATSSTAHASLSDMASNESSLSHSRDSAAAICTLLYGTTPKYFLGACVLGWCLQKSDPDSPRVLLHTNDAPIAWLGFLRDRCGWQLHEVEYMKGNDHVSRRMFHGNIWNNRFRDVFTKLQVLSLPYRKVLLFDLDILVRSNVSELLALGTPAAMVRGEPSPTHGERVPYERFWQGYNRRRWDESSEPELLPRHQQASGINAGVMLLPGRSSEYLDAMTAELVDWEHPEHYPTYMPEQEYLGRWCGTFLGPRAWTHIDCRFNFELDKDVRVPFDFTKEHARYKADVAWGLQNLVVAHFSGLRIKPWDLLFREGDDSSWEGRAHTYVGAPAAGIEEDTALREYADPLTRACLAEWLCRFREMSDGIDIDALLLQGVDVNQERI